MMGSQQLTLKFSSLSAGTKENQQVLRCEQHYISIFYQEHKTKGMGMLYYLISVYVCFMICWQ
jgi:hypothetical protein